MRYKFYLSAVIALSLVGATSSAFAQRGGAAAGGITPGMGGVPPVGTTTPSFGTSSPPVTTGMGTNQPGAPTTSVPGSIGVGASPSGLPGDSTAHPGFPGRVGNSR